MLQDCHESILISQFKAVICGDRRLFLLQDCYESILISQFKAAICGDWGFLSTNYYDSILIMFKMQLALKLSIHCTCT